MIDDTLIPSAQTYVINYNEPIILSLEFPVSDIQSAETGIDGVCGSYTSEFSYYTYDGERIEALPGFVTYEVDATSQQSVMRVEPTETNSYEGRYKLYFRTYNTDY